MALFNRVVNIVVGQPGRNGLEIKGLRVSFSVSKTGSKHPNQSEVRVWNLKGETQRAMERAGTRLVLYAGYEESAGLIKMYEGDVTYSWTRRDGPDLVTQFDLGEGVRELRDTQVSLSYTSASNSHEMMRALAAQMGLGLELGPEVPMRTWANGISFHGPARAAMDRVTRPDGLSWSVQGGVVQVVRTGGPSQRRAIVLASDSGLIGSPERKREGPKEAIRVTDEATGQPARVPSATQGYDGWECRALLMPSLTPNDPIKLETPRVNGVFVIRELRHLGDTHEGDWVTDMTLVDSPTAARLAAQDARTPRRPRE